MQNTSINRQNATTFNITVPVATAFVAQGRDKFPLWREHQMQTDRFNLRPVRESDLIEYIELLSDPAVMRFIGVEAGYIPSFEEIARLHKGAVQAWKSRGYGRWSLLDRRTQEFVGFCGFRSEQGVPELICAIHEKFWNKGIAAEAASKCLSYGFEIFGFTEAKAFTRPENIGAIRVIEKLGGEFLGCVDYHGVESAAYQLLPDSFEF